MNEDIDTGFTFIEILVSVTIIAVLVAIGIGSYASINRQSRDTKRLSDLEQIRGALEQYRADNGQYPVSSWVSSATGTDDWIDALVPEYMDALPLDPKNDVEGGTSPSAGVFIYAYNSGVWGVCVSAGGNEYILTAVLETGEQKSTQYGTCTWDQPGIYAVGER